MDAKDSAENLIDRAQAMLAGEDYRCTRPAKDGTPCTRKHDDKFDDDGAPVYFYALGCEVVAQFCPACRAYWLVATARNALYDYARTTAAERADAAREAVTP